MPAFRSYLPNTDKNDRQKRFSVKLAQPSIVLLHVLSAQGINFANIQGGGRSPFRPDGNTPGGHKPHNGRYGKKTNNTKNFQNMETNLSYDMYVPTRVMFGAGMLNKLSEQPMPGKRAMIVISNGKSTRANGYLSRTEEQLHKAGVETSVFDGVMPNPTVDNVNAGAAMARESGCDFLVALGGGSVMDCTKGIALMATNEGELWDYVPVGSGKGKPITVKPLPIIAITRPAPVRRQTTRA